MTTQELRSYIDRILGNSLRVLLPSYWWKRLFGATLDVVEDVKNTTKTLQKEVNKKATLSKTIVLDWSTTELTGLIEGAIYSIPQDLYGNIAETLTIKDDVWSGIGRVGAADDVAVTVWFKGKTKLSVKKWNEEVTNWVRTPQNLNLSNLDKDKLYRYQRLNVWTSDNSFIPVYTITEYSEGQSWYDSALSETSTNAVQNKVIKAYVDNAVANAGGGSSITELDITNPAQVRDIIAKVREGKHNIYWVGSETQSSSCLSYHIFDDLQLFAITDDIKMYLFDLTGNRLITDKKNRIYIPASRMATNNAQRVKKNSVIYRLIVNNVISGTDCFLYDNDTYKDHQVMECLVRTVGNSTYVDFTTIIDGNKVTFNLIETGQFEGGEKATPLITCDIELSDTSENPVQNKVIKAYVDIEVTKKQDKINDLDDIRSGASLGKTSLQEHQDISHLATKEELQNVVNDILENEEVYAAAVNDLNNRVTTTDTLLATETANREALQTEFQTFKTQVTDNEEVWAIALTDINDRIDTNYQHGEDVYSTKDSLSTEIQTINTTILDNEEVIAATLTDLNNQIAALNALITDLTTRIETLENA